MTPFPHLSLTGFRTLAAASLLAVSCIASAADETGAPVVPGDVPPPRLGITRDGDPVETTQFTGKVLVVTFWASWCGPCLQELPMLEGIQRVAGKDRVQVVAVNIEERDTFRRVHSRLSTLSLLLAHDYNKASREAYGVKGIPHMLIIGRDGRVLKMHRGYGEKSLDAIIAEINAALAPA